jgi:hypothetical protein
VQLPVHEPFGVTGVGGGGGKCTNQPPNHQPPGPHLHGWGSTACVACPMSSMSPRIPHPLCLAQLMAPPQPLKLAPCQGMPPSQQQLLAVSTAKKLPGGAHIPKDVACLIPQPCTTGGAPTTGPMPEFAPHLGHLLGPPKPQVHSQCTLGWVVSMAVRSCPEVPLPSVLLGGQAVAGILSLVGAHCMHGQGVPGGLGRMRPRGWWWIQGGMPVPVRFRV